MESRDGDRKRGVTLPLPLGSGGSAPPTLDEGPPTPPTARPSSLEFHLSQSLPDIPDTTVDPVDISRATALSTEPPTALRPVAARERVAAGTLAPSAESDPLGTLDLGESIAPATLAPPVEVALRPSSMETLPPRQRHSDFPVGEVPTMKTNFAPSEELALTVEHAGRYAFVEELGAGGLGRVSAVRDRHLQRDIAAKELHSAFTGVGSRGGSASSSRTPAEVRFVNEARLTGQLEHPGIVPVYELGRRHDGTLYYTMRRVRGRTLAAALAGRELAGRLELLPQLIAVCNALAYAHSRGVVHRDLTPDNVMLGDFGETVVLDWGLAKRRGEQDVQGVELAAIDERSDVYALGAMLYQLLTGRPPHGGEDARQSLRRVVAAEVVPPTQLEKRCPPALAAIAARALAKDPLARYPDARELATELGAFLTGGLVRAHRYAWHEVARRWVRRHAVAVGVAGAVLAAGGGAYWYRGVLQELARAVTAPR